MIILDNKRTASLIALLKENGSEKYKKNVIKLGIPEENSIGVPTTELRKIARKIPKEERTKALSFSLWQTGYHEAKILSVLIGANHYNDYSKNEILDFMSEINSWDLCDLFCKSILIKRKDFESWIESFIASEALYYKRAGFTLLASMSTHATLTETQISDYLKLIPKFSNDDRLHVKKAASWALRELGKIDEDAKDKSIAVANQMLISNNKAQQWIAKDALKELTLLIRVDERARLISSKSLMGKQTLSKDKQL